MELTPTLESTKLSDSDFSNKSKDNTENDLTCTKSNQDLIKSLKSKLFDELMPHIKIFVRKN